MLGFSAGNDPEADGARIAQLLRHGAHSLAAMEEKATVGEQFAAENIDTVSGEGLRACSARQPCPARPSAIAPHKHLLAHCRFGGVFVTSMDVQSFQQLASANSPLGFPVRYIYAWAILWRTLYGFSAWTLCRS